ncbi:MAG: carboxylesterase family protein [Chitinispirillaceae bacterium]
MASNTERAINCTFLFIVIFLSVSQAADRYKDRVFLSVETREDIPYRIASNFMDTTDTLRFDLYTPSNDADTNRPLIIFIHGGSFINGSRKDDYANSFCTDMALRGYAAVSISYRLGLLGMTESEFRKALYRAMQDSKAAVRFFRANASQYGIDPNLIVCAGFSAGALTSIHHAYISDDMASMVTDEAVLGPLESGENLEYSSEISAVVNYSGAIGDTSWIAGANTPMISIHGTDDATVPFEAGHAFGTQYAPVLYGSACIHRELDRYNITNLLIAAEKETHDLSVNTWSSSYTNVSAFIYELLHQFSPIAYSSSLKPSFSSAAPEKHVFLKNEKMAGTVYNLKGRQIGSARLRNGAGVYLYPKR